MILKNKWLFAVISAMIVLPIFSAQVFAASKLTVEAQGDGYISSYPSGILCGAACVETYNSGTLMTLTAHPNSGATLTGWMGCDESNGATCTVGLDSDKTVIATFSGEVKSEYILRVYRTGSPGVVQSDPFSIYCGSICVYDEAKFEAGSTVKLIASSNSGVKFGEWSGDCSGTSNTCTIIMNGAKTVTATFGTGISSSSATASTLTVQKSGDGSIKSSDKRINCGTACSSAYNKGESIILTATVAPGYTFLGWGGSCSGTQKTCTLTIDGAKKVTAQFSKILSLQVETAGSGKDKILSSDGKINCTKCTAYYPQGEMIILNASASPEWVFDSWTGAGCDSINQPVCKIKMDNVKSVKANFKAIPRYKLTVQKTGYGEGVVESQQDSSLNCGSICSISLLKDTKISIQALPYPRSIFNQWELPCDHDGGVNQVCNFTMTSDKIAVAHFEKAIGTLQIDPLPAGVVVSTDAAKTINCASGCSVKLLEGASLTLKVVLPKNWKFVQWTGDCKGSEPTCTVNIVGYKTVGASLEYVQPFYNLTVVNKYGGSIVSHGAGYVEKINCGEQISKSNTKKLCTAKYAEEANVELTPLQTFGELQWKGCDSRLIDICVVRMDQNKVVEMTMSPGKERELVRQALWNLFGLKNPSLDVYIKNENNPPFKRTLEELQAGRIGHNVLEIEEWIANNIQWFRQEGGIQKIINEWEIGTAKQVLLEVFAAEVARYPTLASFLTDETKKSFQHALADLKQDRGDGGKEGLKSWISTPSNKQWYIDATGIGEYMAAIEKTNLEAEIAAKKPFITSISPDNGMIGGQPRIAGRFYDVQLVTLNGNPVPTINYEDKIIIGTIRWGIDSQGVEVNVPGIVDVYTKWGSASAKLISPPGPIYLNAVGEEEGCFPGVGTGCDGGGIVLRTALRKVFGRPIGCDDPNPDGLMLCSIAVGSIEHDNCCVHFPSGKWCGGPGLDGTGKAGETNHDGHCATEWNHAFWDVFWGRSWKQLYYPGQKFDLTPSGGSRNNAYVIGEAVSSLFYCGPTGHEMREADDALFCCSGQIGTGFWDKNKCT